MCLFFLCLFFSLFVLDGPYCSSSILFTPRGYACAFVDCLICMPYMYALYMRVSFPLFLFFPFFCVLDGPFGVRASLLRSGGMRVPLLTALYVCLICMLMCMPYMYALYVCMSHVCAACISIVCFCVCLICMPYMYALYVCLICMPYMYALLYVCLICMPYMYALHVCLICMPYVYALYACLICMPYMYALYVCLICMLMRLPYMYAFSSAGVQTRFVLFGLFFCCSRSLLLL